MIATLRSAWERLAHYPRLTVIAAGAIGACAYPPLGLWPLGLIAAAILIALLHRADRARQAFLIGWLFGWAHLTLANNWIAIAFTFQAEMPMWLGWLAVPLLCIYLAIYPGMAALAAHVLARRAGVLPFGAMLAACWIVTEWLRSWVFTGYPWPPLGLMLVGGWDTPGIARILPWLGTYALSGAVLVIAALLIWALVGRRWAALVITAIVTVAAMHWPGPAPRQGSVRYSLVQPLIPQEEINDPRMFEAQYQRIARLTQPSDGAPRVVLWPESAVPDYLEEGYPDRYYVSTTAAADPVYARQRIGGLLGEGSMLLTGLVHLDIGEKDGMRRAVSARNAVSAINPDGELVETYAKAHLVPYGEYLPMRGLLEPLGLSRLVAGTIDYVPGPGARSIDLGDLGKAGIQICYEIVFSGQVVDRGNRPDYIFNPSNDGWFGHWATPQFLGQARMRAIEEGLPVVRATTTGVSAVVDADGVVRQTIGRNRADRADGLMPPARPATLFARLGNILPLGWALVLAAGSLVAMRRRRV